MDELSALDTLQRDTNSRRGQLVPGASEMLQISRVTLTIGTAMDWLHLFLEERGHKFLSACKPTAFSPRLGVDARAETQVLLKGVLHLIDERPIVETDIALFVVGE